MLLLCLLSQIQPQDINLSAPYPTLPYPTLLYSTLHYPTLPYLILPYPILPYPTLVWCSITIICPFVPHFPSLPIDTWRLGGQSHKGRKKNENLAGSTLALALPSPFFSLTISLTFSLFISLPTHTSFSFSLSCLLLFSFPLNARECKRSVCMWYLCFV